MYGTGIDVRVFAAAIGAHPAQSTEMLLRAVDPRDPTTSACLVEELSGIGAEPRIEAQRFRPDRTPTDHLAVPPQPSDRRIEAC